MSPNPAPPPTSLEDALYALSLESERLDASILDAFVRRYPCYARELTDFAVELAIDTLRFPNEQVDLADDEEIASPAVQRAVSHFQNRLYEETQKSRSATLKAAQNPFQELPFDEVGPLLDKLSINNVFFMKLRDRQIEPDTIPAAFIEEAAAELPVSVPVLSEHFNAPQDLVAAPQRYKADGKPRADLRQTFSDAVQSSSLTDEQVRRLLSL